MKQIFDDRSSGKTSRLILLAKEAGGVIVCRYPAAMKEKAIGYGITGVDFVSYRDYPVFMLSNKKPVFIDELSCFWEYFDPNFIGYSESKEDRDNEGNPFSEHARPREISRSLRPTML